MPSRFRICLARDRLAAGLVVAAIAVPGCGRQGPLAAVPSPDRVVVATDDDPGQFVVECAFDRFAADDPIVHPGEPGVSHLHQFFGAVGVTAESTHEDLLAGDTTCGRPADTASYWTPVVLDAQGVPIEPLGLRAYYRPGPDVDPLGVIPFPPGLTMVAGDQTATEPQPLSVVAWSCGTGSDRREDPPDCTGATSMRMWVTFPDCWNGVDARSEIPAEPSRHVAYSAAGECPSSHPVHIPQLQLAVDLPVVAADEVGELALSSGDIHSAHADFWNAWDPGALRRQVTGCIHRSLPCGTTG